MLEILINDSILDDTRILSFLNGKNKIIIKDSVVEPNTEGVPIIETIDAFLEKAIDIRNDCELFSISTGLTPEVCAFISFKEKGDDTDECLMFDFLGKLYFDGKKERLLYIGPKLPEEQGGCHSIWEIKKTQ